MGELKREFWTSTQDELLLSTVIEHLKEGKKQKRAFEEFSQKTGRTVAAVSLRFHSYIRKRYKDELSSFNLRSIKIVNMPYENMWIEDENENDDWEKARSLLSYQLSVMENLQKKNSVLRRQLVELGLENNRIKAELEELRNINNFDTASTSVSSVLKLFEQAQSLGFLDKNLPRD